MGWQVDRAKLMQVSRLKTDSVCVWGVPLFFSHILGVSRVSLKLTSGSSPSDPLLPGGRLCPWHRSRRPQLHLPFLPFVPEVPTKRRK